MREQARGSTLRRRGVIGCAAVALLGCVLVTAANLIGILIVDDHNPISETISKLAIGDYAWIQDFGLDAFAVSLFALALGLYLSLTGGWRLGLEPPARRLGVSDLCYGPHTRREGAEAWPGDGMTQRDVNFSTGTFWCARTHSVEARSRYGSV